MVKKIICTVGKNKVDKFRISKSVEKKALDRVLKKSKRIYASDRRDFLDIVDAYKKGNIPTALAKYNSMDTVVRDDFSSAFSNNNSDVDAMVLFSKRFNIKWNVNEWTVKNKKVRAELQKEKYRGVVW